MKTRRLLPAAIVPAAALALAACAAADPGTDTGGGNSDGIDIVVTAYPMQFIAASVVGDVATVTNVAPSGTEPHDVELSPAAVADITQADAVFMLGGFQASVDDAVAEVSGGTTVLDVAQMTQLHEAEDHDEDDHTEDDHTEDDHDHGGIDPHFWLDPNAVSDVAAALATDLGAIDPDNADTYTANAQALAAELATLNTDYESALSACSGATLVTSHEAFGYLARAYGMEQVGITGLDPEAEPSPARIAQVLAEAQAAGVTTIFNEPGGIVAGAQEVADELGVTLATLNPLELEPADGDYLTEMRVNLTALVEGLPCT